MTFQRIVRPAAATDVDPYNVSLFPKPPAWTEDAACAGQDPELFFADADRMLVQAAKRVCRGCDVREQCLRDAIETNEQYGIRGGINFANSEHRNATRRRLGREGVA